MAYPLTVPLGSRGLSQLDSCSLGKKLERMTRAETAIWRQKQRFWNLRRMGARPMIATGLHQRQVPGSRAAKLRPSPHLNGNISTTGGCSAVSSALGLLVFAKSKGITPKASTKSLPISRRLSVRQPEQQLAAFVPTPVMPQQLAGQRKTDPAAFAPPVSSTQHALSVAGVCLEPAIAHTAQIPGKSSGAVTDSPPAKASFKCEEEAGLSGGASPASSTAGVSEEPNNFPEEAASFAALELSPWRSILGLATIRRAVIASVWSPAAHAYRSAVSAASALVPYVWSSKPAASVQEGSSASIASSQAARVLSSAPSCGDCNVLKAEGEKCETGNSSETAGENPFECVRCPYCSGVFRWQEAQRVPDMGGVDLCVQRGPPPPMQEAVSARFNKRGPTADGALQVARKCSSVRPHQRQRVRKSSSVLEAPENTSNNRAQPTGYSSDCRSTQIVKHRHPRWIRFLAKRLMCFHASEGRRVREQPQDSERQGHATARHRHVRLKPRSRGQAAKEPSPSRNWRQRSEEVRPGLSVAPEALQECTVGACVDNSGATLEHQSPCVASKASLPTGHQHIAAVLPGSSSTPGSGDARAASGGTCAELPDFSSCSSVAAIDVGPVESPPAEKPKELQTPPNELSTNCARPAQQAVKMMACMRPGGHHAPQVNLWPLISLEALNMDHSSPRLAFDKLEKQRVRFNALNRKQAVPPAGTGAWNRRGEMQRLSDLLVSASVRSMLALDCAMPCVHSHDGLQVWKGESGSGNFTCRATFLLPVEPRLYATFASDSELRCQWDKNMTEQHVVEEVDAGHDVCYVAFRRIATVYPRDLVTLRVKCRLPVRAKSVEAAGAPTASCTPPDSPEVRDGAESEADVTAYSSMSCSIDHPDVPETPGRVRMDVRVNAYLAMPVRTPFGLWSEVTLVNESDPGGWIPSAVTRTMCAKLLPSTVEKFSAQILKH
ncbi:hypothetical protein Esti_000239 [Eimeria stiedai]